MQNLTQVTEVEITYKSKQKPSERTKIMRSSESVDVFRTIQEFNANMEYKEMFYVMYLNRGNKILSVIKISEGGTAGTVVDTKHIMQGAILQNASSMILCHNHPSGECRPSQADIDITNRIKQGAKLFDIGLLDHVILTPESFYSFADEGQI